MSISIEDQDLIQQAKKHLGEFQLSAEWMTAGSVSAAILSSSGRIYTGICIDVGCSIGFCAEHAAIAEMLKARETRIEKVVAITTGGKVLPPCGRCREFMMQINSENQHTEVLLEGGTSLTLDELLPHRWL